MYSMTDLLYKLRVVLETCSFTVKLYVIPHVALKDMFDVRGAVASLLPVDFAI